MKINYKFTNIPPHYLSFLWCKLVIEKSFDFYFFFEKNKSSNTKEIDFSTS